MSSIPLFLTPYSFTRPTDTTAYAASDLIANDVDAADVVPLSWTIPGLKATGGIIEILGAFIRKTTVTFAAFDVKLELFNATPTFVTAGDNSGYGTVVATGSAAWIGHLDLVGASLVNTHRSAAAAAALMRPITTNVPFYARMVSRTMYGLLQARNSYAPGNAEVFTVQPIVRIVG